MGGLSADHMAYTTRWRVRTYELDVNGHVNNAVYLNWAEQIATEHTEAAGFGRAWMLGHGAAWVVRRHEVTYHRPAVYGEELEVTTRVVLIKGARGIRQTIVMRVSDGVLIAEMQTEWVWMRLQDGRPARVPEALVGFFSRGGAGPT